MCMNKFTRFFQWKHSSVVSERMNNHGSILARFHHLIEIADSTETGRDGERPILPARAIDIEQETPHQIGSGHIFVACDGNQWPLEFPCHIFDEPRLSASRRTL